MKGANRHTFIMVRMSGRVDGDRPGGGEKPGRPCARADCDAPGDHRAPRSPSDLGAYYWFCLEHVREYNARWDFFDGMNSDEIEAFRRDDVTGHRPTWPMAAGRAFRNVWDNEGLRDLFGVFGKKGPKGPKANGGANGGANGALPTDECDALAVLNLDPTVTRADIKVRFKELVKRHHPDVNGGDRSAEDRLKRVIEAYRLLLGSRPA